MKISPVGAELFHEDGRTDMTELIAAFRNFANAPQDRQVDVLTADTAWALQNGWYWKLLFRYATEFLYNLRSRIPNEVFQEHSRSLRKTYVVFTTLQVTNFPTAEAMRQ